MNHLLGLARGITVGTTWLALFWNCATAAPLVVISIDGMRPDAILQAKTHGLKVPNLLRFVAEGAYAEGVIGVYPTVTLPSHTTIVTGVDPAVHGIVNNTLFDPTYEHVEGNLWGRDIKVQTLWQAASSAGLKVASVNWPVTIDAPGIAYNIPPYIGPPNTTHSDIRLIEALSRPDGYLIRLEDQLGPFAAKDMNKWDRQTEEYAEHILREERPALLAVHFVELDEVQHRVGIFRPQGAEVIERIDRLVGELLHTALEVNPSTAVIVVSDHGFADIHAEVNLVVALSQAGLITLSSPNEAGKRHVQGWAVSVLDSGGSAGIYLHDPNNARVRARARAALWKLRTPELGIDRILDGVAARATGGFPGAAFVVNLRPGFAIGNSTSGPVIVRRSGGTHGYFPDRPDMRASFFALGGELPFKGNLGVINMKQLAPTLAALLGVPFRAGGPPLLPTTPRADGPEAGKSVAQQ